MKRIERNWTARTFPDTPVTPAAVLSSPSGSSVESSWEIHVATLLFAFYWIMRKFKIVFLLYHRGRLFLFSCFSFHFPTLFMAINCIILQCLKWMFWHRIMGWIYSVSCEAIWCLSHLKKKKKSYFTKTSPGSWFFTGNCVVCFKNKVTCPYKTQSYLGWVRNGLYTESNTGSLFFFQHRRHVMSDCFAYVKNKRFEEETMGLGCQVI